MQTYHEWESEGKRYRAVYDETHETRGSYGYATEEETREAEEEEIRNLESGKWVVLGVIVFEKVPHCASCTCPETVWSWTETDSFWGIVVENETDAIERFVKEGM